MRFENKTGPVGSPPLQDEIRKSSRCSAAASSISLKRSLMKPFHLPFTSKIPENEPAITKRSVASVRPPLPRVRQAAKMLITLSVSLAPRSRRFFPPTFAKEKLPKGSKGVKAQLRLLIVSFSEGFKGEQHGDEARRAPRIGELRSPSMHLSRDVWCTAWWPGRGRKHAGPPDAESGFRIGPFPPAFVGIVSLCDDVASVRFH